MQKEKTNIKSKKIEEKIKNQRGAPLKKEKKGQGMGRVWAGHGQGMGRAWAGHGQGMGRAWAGHGQDTGRTRQAIGRVCRALAGQTTSPQPY